jgi:general secretion pathway protein L
MLESSEQWQLFGYDVSQLGKRWQAAWRDFLWGDDSPVRRRLDEVVRVKDGEAVRYFHADEEINAQSTECEAVLLPTEYVLVRALSVPLAAESELDAVMALEVAANSPFPAADTGSGWRITDRTEHSLEVLVAIVSLSSTMGYMGRQYDQHDVHASEVWAPSDKGPVMLRGFGEQSRLQRYKSRLIKVFSLLAIGLVLILATVALAGAAKYQELRQVQATYERVQEEAGLAVQMRSRLVGANEAITVVQENVGLNPNPRYELAKLTALLPDGAWLTGFTMTGRNIELRGSAEKASELLELLINDPSYTQVESPGGFTVNRTTRTEDFNFRLTIAGEGAS